MKIFGLKKKTCPGKTGCRAMVALRYVRSVFDKSNTEKSGKIEKNEVGGACGVHGGEVCTGF